MDDALNAEWRRTSDSQEEGRVTIVWEDDTEYATVWEVAADMTSQVADHIIALHNASISPPVRETLPERGITMKQAIAGEQVRIGALLVEAMCEAKSNVIRDFIEPLLPHVAPSIAALRKETGP